MALGAAYIDSRMQPTQNDEYLWHDTLQYLNELGRQKHHQSARYQQYAIHAQQLQQTQVAALFRAMAFAESVKCENCKDAIGSLGGVFEPPISSSTTISNTKEHIRSALDEKLASHNSHASECISKAIEEGNRYVARMLTWCDASDVKMILILQCEFDAISADDDTAAYRDTALHSGFRVCPNCGNIDNEVLHTQYCPHCMTQQSEFILFN